MADSTIITIASSTCSANSSIWRLTCDYNACLGGCTGPGDGALGVRMPIIPWGRLASCPGCAQATPAHGDSHAIMNAHWADALAGDEGGSLGVRMPIIPWGRLVSCPAYVQTGPATGDSHAIMNACWGDALAGDEGGGLGVWMPVIPWDRYILWSHLWLAIVCVKRYGSV